MGSISKYALACTLVAALALSGCASGAPDLSDMDQTTRNPVPESAIEQGNVVKVVVEDPDGGEPLADADVKIEEGMTALDALTELDIMVAVSESSFGPFVQVIDSISNEGSSGWTYSVNGETPSVSSGAYDVEPGDTIVWSYYRA